MNTPLALLLRPKSFDEIVGQEHLVGKNAKLRKLVESDKLTSILLFGPAGTGKTTIAEVISTYTKSKFVKLNSTSATVKDIRKIGEEAKTSGTPITIFLDECHRSSRVQQDILLPYTESGDIILIGATTENIYFSVNQSLISRSQLICELEPLKPIHLIKLLKKGIDYYKSQNINLKIDQEAAKHIIVISCGDGRKVLSTLEIAATVAEDHHITLELVKEISPSKHMVFNDQIHFDISSALQGSIQASDPDSAIYWLAKWLETGEDPRYIARRIMVSASEDASGNPEAASVAHSAYIAACEIGRPECDIILAHAVVLIASSPRNKSAACAIWAALKDVREGVDIEVPKSMKDSHYPGSEKLGHGSYHDGMNQSNYIGVNKKYYRPEDWNE